MKEKDTTTKFVEDLADKLGYKLVKKERDQREAYVPSDADRFKDMGSKSLMSEIKMIEQDMLKFGAKNEAVKQAVNNFMTRQQANEVTKVLFEGTRFLTHRLKVYNESQTELRKLKDYLTGLLKVALESETKDRFEAYNPDMAGELSSIAVEQTPMGMELAVRIKSELTEKEKTKPIEVE